MNAPGHPARLMLVDDHAMVRRGLRMVVDAEPDLSVVAEAGDGIEALERAREIELDLVVLDVSMPRMTGLQAASELIALRPGLRVLMLSMHDNEQYLFEALKAGASGYVLKTAADHDLVAACRASLRGEPFLYPSAIAALVRDFLTRTGSGEDEPADPLTPRELQVVKLIAEAYSNEQIAEVEFPRFDGRLMAEFAQPERMSVDAEDPAVPRRVQARGGEADPVGRPVGAAAGEGARRLAGLAAQLGQPA